MPSPSRSPASSVWRTRLLLTEFTALAVLVGSMVMIGQWRDTGATDPRWLWLPLTASLVVFACFLGLMYERWHSQIQGQQARRLPQVVFGLLALTLLALWGAAAWQVAAQA